MEFDFKEYDKVLIGIGDDFNTKIPDECKNAWDEYDYIKNNIDTNIVEAYNNLAKKLDGIDYYIVSTCTDDLIYKSNIDATKVVTPCGGFRFLQCIDDCSHQLLPFEEDMYDNRANITCPFCHKEVVFNKLPLDKYNEGGYMDAWQDYNKWLQSTINKKLLIIEAGVGLAYPTVIRFPFEKTAFYNQKSVMYRIHETLAFSTPELKERCICVKSNPVELLKNI